MKKDKFPLFIRAIIHVNNKRYLTELAKKVDVHYGSIEKTISYLEMIGLVKSSKGKLKRIIKLTEKGKEYKEVCLKLISILSIAEKENE